MGSGGGGFGLPGLPGIGGGSDKKDPPKVAPAVLNKQQKKQVRNQVNSVIKTSVLPELEKLYGAVTGNARVTAYDVDPYANAATRGAFSSSGDGISGLVDKLSGYLPLIVIGFLGYKFLLKK